MVHDVSPPFGQIIPTGNRKCNPQLAAFLLVERAARDGAGVEKMRIRTLHGAKSPTENSAAGSWLRPGRASRSRTVWIRFQDVAASCQSGPVRPPGALVGVRPCAL